MRPPQKQGEGEGEWLCLLYPVSSAGSWGARTLEEDRFVRDVSSHNCHYLCG